MRWIDRARLALARLVGFPEAFKTPVDPAVFSQGSQPDWSLEVGWDRRYCVDRAQQLHRANLLAGSILDRSAEHVIGPGFRLQVRTKDAGFNRDARLMWEEWANNPRLCDVRERSTFAEMQTQHYMGYQRDGDSAYLMRADGRVRVVNSIEIASPVGGYWRTTDADGVETDRDGKHIAYWIHEPDEIPYSNIRAAVHRLMRVPAKDVVFTARTPLGAAQTRGITAFLGTFGLLEQVDGTLIAWGSKAQTAARFAMVILKKSPIPGVSFGTAATRNQTTEIKNGTITRLEPDEDIKPVQSADPTSNLIDLAKVMIRIVGTRFCLSLATVTLDHSDHNFSNARASRTETNNGTEARQRESAGASSEIRNMKTLQWIKEGKLRATKRSTLIAALKHRWRFPRQPLVDPLGETQADLLGLDAGTTTWEEIAGRKGTTPRELFREQAKERKLRAFYKLPDVRSNMTREEAPKAIEPPKGKGEKAHANGVNRMAEAIDEA